MQKLGWSMSEFLSKSLARRTRRRSADGKGLLVTGAAVAQPVSEKCKNKYFSQGSRNKVWMYSHFARVKQSARFHVHSSTNFTTSLVWYLYFMDQKLVMTYDVLRDGNYSTPSWGKLEGREEGRKEEGKGAWFLGLFPLLKSTELHFGKDRQRPRSRILAQSYKMKKLLYPQMLRTISLGCRKKWMAGCQASNWRNKMYTYYWFQFQPTNQ